MGVLGVFRSLRSRGNTFVDYLLLSLVIAGIAIPIVMRFFGDPIRQTLFNNRQSLVDFLAQTPKRPVPNLWFAKERVASPPDPNVDNPGAIDDPADGGEGPKIAGPGRIDSPNISAPRDISAPTISDVGEISSGVAGPGGLGSGAGGPGSSSGSDGGLDSDFFSKKSGTGSEDSTGAAGASGKSATPLSIGSSESDGSERDFRDGKIKKDSKKEEQDSKSKSETQSRKYQNEQLARLAQDEKAKERAFNWWFLIKILIIFAIFFLVILIVLGSARKR